MTITRYGDFYREPGTATINTMGSMANDGWTIAARLPNAKISDGNRQLVFIVNFKVANIQRTGSWSAAPSGVIQVRLGKTSGARAPTYDFRLTFLEQAADGESIQGQFLCVVTVGDPDPFFGARHDTAGSDLCLWARTFWNLDQPTYAVSFELADVNWLWFYVDDIPALELIAYTHVPAAPQLLSSTLAGLYEHPAATGNAGEKWVHFVNCTYSPQAPPQHGKGAASFRFGYSDGVGYANFVTKVGSRSRWGQERTNGNAGVNATLHQGGLWYGEQPAGTFIPGLMAVDRVAQAPFPQVPRTLFNRYAYVALRLDNLEDVLALTEDNRLNATCNNGGSSAFQYPDVFVPMERPETGYVSNALVLTHGIVNTTGVYGADGALTTNTGRVLEAPGVGALTDPSRSEGISTMSITPFAVGASWDDLQYRAHFVLNANGPPIPLSVSDIAILQLSLVAGTSKFPQLEPVPPDPIQVIPGREAPAMGSLVAPPIAPDAVMDEDPDHPVTGIRGDTGYRRRWPTFSTIRSTVTIAWQNLSPANLDTVKAFLDTNVVFKHQLRQRLSESALAQVDDYDIRATSGQLATVTVRCVELVFVG